MCARLILFLLMPDYATIGLGLALAIGVGSLVVWFVRRRTSKPAAFILVQGLTWFVEGKEILGPCCDGCRVRLMARPLASTPDGVAHYEFCCPECGKVPARRGFTLLELTELDRAAGQMWSDRHTQGRPSPPTVRLH